jgi:hypothetical protein
MNIKSLLPVLASMAVLLSCKSLKPALNVTVKNTLKFDRKEVVSLSYSQLYPLLKRYPANTIRVKKIKSGNLLPLQWVDNNRDGTTDDELLFVADVKSLANEKYQVIIDSSSIITEPETQTYCRLVPERSDDFAWENDKVAFRVYGPKGQQEARAGVPGSTLSSGIDIWLKKVTYPVINKWYAGHVKTLGYYHTDRGEGYDPYHVGASRGTGGIGIWVNDSLMVSDNFSNYRIIATGPIRTIFELDYHPWSDYVAHETKRISLDAGSNFSKFEISLSADAPLPNIAIGISLHKNNGDAKLDKQTGRFRHWEAIDDSFVGEGIVLDPSMIQDAFANVSRVTDQSNLLVLAKHVRYLTYYAGFAWTKSGQVLTVADWDAMLKKQAQIIAQPLKIMVE